MTDRTKIYRHIRDRFAGDGAPHWMQGKGKFARPRQTAIEAEGLRRKQVRHLRKAAEDGSSKERQAALSGIADQIDACRPRKRSWCRHPACPCCVRSLQRWFVWTAPIAAKRAAKRRDPETLSFLSVIPSVRLALGSSPAHVKKTVAALLATLKKAMAGAEVTFLFGGLDVSVNIGLDGEERLQPQLWAAGLTAELRRAERALREAFPASATTPRPVLIRPYDGNPSAFAYATKNEFIQRVSLAPSLQDDDNGDAEGGNDWVTARPGSRATDKPRNTRNKTLTIAQNADVALFLDALGSDRRLFLVGFEVERNRNREAVIRPTAEAVAKLALRAGEQIDQDDTNPNDSDDGEPDDHGYGAEGASWDAEDRVWFEDKEDGNAEGEQEPDYEDHEPDDEEKQDEDNHDENEAYDEGQTSPVERVPIGQQCTDEANLKAWVNIWANHYRAQARMRGQELGDAQVIKLLEARIKSMPST